MKGKCKYCGIQLKDIVNIRCDKCDYAWQEGRIAGEQNIKSDIKEVWGKFLNLIDFRS